MDHCQAIITLITQPPNTFSTKVVLFTPFLQVNPDTVCSKKTREIFVMIGRQEVVRNELTNRQERRGRVWRKNESLERKKHEQILELTRTVAEYTNLFLDEPKHQEVVFCLNVRGFSNSAMMVVVTIALPGTCLPPSDIPPLPLPPPNDCHWSLQCASPHCKQYLMYLQSTQLAKHHWMTIRTTRWFRPHFL